MTWKPLDISDEDVDAFAKEVSKRARFQVDESVDSEVADYLRLKGFNVKTAQESGLIGHADEDHLAAAQRDDRILLTCDEDFLDDRKHPPNRNPGLVVLPKGLDDLAKALFFTLRLVAPFREIWRSSKIEVKANGEIKVKGFEADTAKYTIRRYKMGRKGPSLEWVDD